MSIVRIKKTKEYFVASNVPFNDERLSWEARGLLGYLLSKPDDWRVLRAELIKRSPAGDHKVRRILKELEKYGYLKRERLKDSEGKFYWISTVYEKPMCRKSTCGEATPLISTELINTESITLSSKTDDKNNLKSKTKTIKTPSDQQKMVGVLSRVTGLDYKISANRSRLGKDAKELVQAEYAPDIVEKLYTKDGWWYRNDWRGKKGQPPKLHDIKETIGVATKSVLPAPKPRPEVHKEWEVIEERLWNDEIDFQGIQADGTLVSMTFNRQGQKVFVRERRLNA